METFTRKIEEIIDAGWNVEEYDYYANWAGRVASMLEAAIDEEAANVFRKIGEGAHRYGWGSHRNMQIGHLEGLVLKIEAKGLTSESKRTEQVPALASSTKKVFVVHGHDTEIKESVARFLEKLSLDPIILHEQPNSGKTIIEKFETFSDVGFAVILLTPDDVGASKEQKENLYPRARQNVILELGYFTGKLGRHRVCPLYKSGVEIPSDYQGVIYTELDEAGAWKTKLSQELVQAGFSINLEALIKG